MAQLSYRANLSAKSFPFRSDQGGKTVIVKGPDQNYTAKVAASSDTDQDIGIPQLYYGHNFLPTSTGIRSIGLQKTANAPSIAGIRFGNTYQVITEDGELLSMAVTSGGRCLVLRAPLFNFWQQVAAIPGIENGLVTVAHVSGISYIYFENVGCYKLDTSTMSLVEVTLGGVDKTLVKGVVESSGYLIVFDELRVLWCSTIDPTDFVPSLTTGAGGGNVEDARGKIVTCKANTYGIMVYCEDNIVVGLASNNSRYPFTFRALSGSNGISNPDHVTAGSDSETQYAFTKAGLQAVTSKAATTVFTELTDFLADKVVEDYDISTMTFSTITSAAALIRKIVYIGNRYLSISYGAGEDSTHSIVYDTALKRYGKIRKGHVSCFEYTLVNAVSHITEAPFAFFGILTASGDVYRLSIEDEYMTDSVFYLGRYQYVRARTIQLQGVDIELVSTDPDKFSLYAGVSLDGKNVNHYTLGYLMVNLDGLRKYNFCAVGENVTLVGIGSFDLSSVELQFNIHGKR